MNPKSAAALSWIAIFINGLGLIVTALSAQFIFSAFAAVLALIPTVFARKGPQIFGGAVLVASLLLAFTGYSNYEQDPYMQRAKEKSGKVSKPSPPRKEKKSRQPK